MKADRFFELLQNIDKKLIARAAKRRNNNKAIIIRMVAFAACLAIVVTGGVHIMLSRAPKVSALAVAEYPEQVPYPTADLFTERDLYMQQYDAWSNNKVYYKIDSTGNADYVKKLVSSLIEDDGKNKVVSPANIYFALAMLCETTDGNSQKQILDLIGKSDVESLRENSYKLWKKTYSDDGHTTSILANSLWLNENCAKNYKQSTFDILKDKYFASAYSGDFKKEQYITTIRDWINEQTGGLLKDNVKKLNFSPETVMALVSTIYYKAPWQNEFIVSNTKRGVFHSKNGDIEAEFMNEKDYMGSVYYSDNFVSAGKALEEGYMHFILPDEGYTVDDILKDEKALELISQNYSAVENKGVIVNLSVPKFDVSFDTDLVPSLKKLGVTDVFEMGKADFSPVGDVENMFISKAEHAARLKIDETGVEAAAYTAMGLCGGGIPDDEVDFVLDRPFIFVITGYDNLPLFVGIVNNP